MDFSLQNTAGDWEGALQEATRGGEGDPTKPKKTPSREGRWNGTQQDTVMCQKAPVPCIHEGFFADSSERLKSDSFFL